MGKKARFILSGFVLVVLIGSCSMFLGTTIEERVSIFKESLNDYDGSNIEDLMSNFSKETENINSINTADYWNSSIFRKEYQPFDIIDVSYGSSSASGTISYTSADTTVTENIYFEFNNDGAEFIGEDWKIKQIWLGTKDVDGEQIKILSN